MKRSIIGANLQNRPLLQSQTQYIPVCDSSSQFFTLGLAKKKKRNFNQPCTSSISCSNMQNENKKFYHSYKASQQKAIICDALTSATDSTNQTDHAICFRKKQMKQKMNRGHSVALGQLKSCSISPRKRQNNSILMKRSSTKIKMTEFLQPNKNWSIQNFIVIKKIGQGSYSKVYLVMEKQSHFLCALKVINKKLIKQQNLTHIVIRQLKIHHFLKHKNIVQLYGQFDDKENVYLICQYCTDGTLFTYMKQKQKYNQQIDGIEASQIIKQISKAILLLHNNYLMHRDIKPQNIFLTFGNTVKVGDFGWSVYCGDNQLRNTQCGTPLYLAPELIQQNQYSYTVDIWAIGILTYQLLTGQIPFKIRQPQDLIKIVHQNIKFEYIQCALTRDFVMKLLQRDTKLRIQIEDVLQHPFLQYSQEND